MQLNQTCLTCFFFLKIFCFYIKILYSVALLSVSLSITILHSHNKEGSSGGNLGNISPGDSAGVKDVANVVVKYPSPYLKQGSNVSKVRTRY